MKKDPSVIEREEMEKIGKVWVNIVRRDIPKHHRIFTTFHRKLLIDAKRFSENCQREVRIMLCSSYSFTCRVVVVLHLLVDDTIYPL